MEEKSGQSVVQYENEKPKTDLTKDKEIERKAGRCWLVGRRGRERKREREEKKE